ncbi:MAG TPA: hypothetical protein VHC73_06790 [Vitreimonas sp.]|jgi:hypothetical protein|nr:hypothetical protein [Vitreimonas sp.]
MSERDPLQSLWMKQKPEPFAMSLDEVHTRAVRLQQRVQTRNRGEYLAAILVIGVFAYTAIQTPAPLAQLGAVLIVLGTIYVVWQLHRLGRAATKAETEAAGASWSDFYRAQLVKQHAAVSSVWSWYLGPLVPGFIVFVAGVAFAPAGHAPLFARIAIFAVTIGIAAAAFLGIAALNRAAARALQREIDSLDALTRT